jgi:hypothetical protein
MRVAVRIPTIGRPVVVVVVEASMTILVVTLEEVAVASAGTGVDSTAEAAIGEAVVASEVVANSGALAVMVEALEEVVAAMVEALEVAVMAADPMTALGVVEHHRSAACPTEWVGSVTI